MIPLRKHSNFAAIPHRQMVARLETIPLEHRLKEEFYELFRKWSDSSGPVWAVERTKALRDCIMQSRAHGGLTHKPTWVATTKSGNLRGTYGSMYRVAMASYKGFKAVLNLLQLYTVWRQRTLCVADYTDIQQNVQVAPVVTGTVGCPGAKVLRKLLALWRSKGNAFNDQVGLKRPQRVKCKPCTPLSQVLPGKRSHVAQLGIDMVAMRHHPIYASHPEPIRQALGGYLLDNSPGAEKRWEHSALQAGWTEDEIREFRSVSGVKPVAEANSVMGRKPVGKVNCTLEPGLKVRYFAAPNIVIQRATEPLQEALLRFLTRLPWDCTLHQRKADASVIDAMRHGRTVHTVDMSKATDNFPWEYQKAVLKAVCNTHDPETSDQIGLITSLVEQGQWYLGSGRRLKRLTWTRGQPLGLNPSFFLFTITHGLVLWALNEGRWDNKFFVLGDDVIILDDRLAVRYKKWLSDVGITISQAKTFSSSEVGQFAGKTYTPHGAFWAPKWNEITRQNLLDACAWFYPGLSRWFPKDRKTIDRVLSLPPPYGNGWNPTGLSLDDRLSPEIISALLEREKERAAKAAPSSYSCSYHTIRTAAKAAGMAPSAIIDSAGLVVEDHRAVRPSTRWTASIPHWCYAPETEVPGAPRIRFNGTKVDPYSKGSLQAWKQVFELQPACQD